MAKTVNILRDMTTVTAFAVLILFAKRQLFPLKDKLIRLPMLYSVYRSRLGIWGRDFDCYHIRPPMSTLIPTIGVIKTWHLIDRRCEVIVVANTPKYSVDSH